MDDRFESGDEVLSDIFSPDERFVRLSHLNNKSSVLCTQSRDITTQYLALQQIDAHQRMVTRAKGCVDNSAPKSLQSYISVAGQQKKKLWKKSLDKSNSFAMNENYDASSRPNSSGARRSILDEEENHSLHTPSVNKAVQTRTTLTFDSMTANKISWYLEAVRQGEFLYPQDFAQNNMSANIYKHHNQQSNYPRDRRSFRSSFMERHDECFIHPTKPFMPRILADNVAKSKVKDMRVYRSPHRLKKSESSQSSDTFESYNDEEETNEEDSDRKSSDNPSFTENGTSLNRPLPNLPSVATNVGYAKEWLQKHRGRHYETLSASGVTSSNEEDKYLNFLSKVTEDILRGGVYSDRAIRQAFDFHIQFYQDDPDKNKLKSLLDHILENLKVENENAHGDATKNNSTLVNATRANTPPVKDAVGHSLNLDSITAELNQNAAAADISSLNQSFSGALQLNQNSDDVTSKEELQDR